MSKCQMYFKVSREFSGLNLTAEEIKELTEFFLGEFTGERFNATQAKSFGLI